MHVPHPNPGNLKPKLPCQSAKYCMHSRHKHVRKLQDTITTSILQPATHLRLAITVKEVPCTKKQTASKSCVIFCGALPTVLKANLSTYQSERHIMVMQHSAQSAAELSVMSEVSPANTSSNEADLLRTRQTQPADAQGTNNTLAMGSLFRLHLTCSSHACAL